MQAYLKDPANDLDYSIFETHFDEQFGKEPMQYRYCPRTSKEDEHVKIALGNKQQVKYTMKEAGILFGKRASDIIPLQYEIETRHESIMWYHV